MQTKNKLITPLLLSVSAVAATAIINKVIKISASSRKILVKPEAHCYKWRLGTIHYTVSGSGKPLLLIHDLAPESNSYEWNYILHSLSEHYKVYSIDLLGCGRSEKPNISYTNYLYVQLLSDFIRSEIGHRTDVIATGASSSISIMACSLNPELFDRLLFINPESILSSSQIPGKNAKFYKFILDLPVLGTLLYNFAVSKKSIEERFTKEYFYNPFSVRSSCIDAYYESAHLGNSPKSVFASVQCNYTKCNILTALKRIDNSIYLLGGSSVDDIEVILSEYKLYNPAIEYAIIPNTKHLPQLEAPQEVLNAIYTFF